MTDYNKHFSMTKQKGDRKVRTWSHPRSGLSADIYLRETRFVALFLEKTFEAPDVRMLEKKMSDYAEHWIQMEWYPVIEVEIDDDRHSYRGEITKEGLAFGFKRFYLSQSPVGEIFSVGWDVETAHRKASMESWGGGYRHHDNYSTKIKLIGLPLGAPLKKDAGWLLDYNETLWLGFVGIRDGLMQLRKRLREMVGTREGLKQLMKGGKLLLTQ